MMKVVAVVVTYNRKKLLLECVEAILKQTYKVNEILIIDNNSTDGTYEYIKEFELLENKEITYIKLEKNIGGAGGFHEGIKISREKGFDWLWIMDDDTIPKENCLENLIKAKENLKNEKISFLASCIYGECGEFMNVPAIDDIPSNNGYAGWYKYLEKGIVSIKDATFVSILINGEAIKQYGLPIKDYFIWGDDTEYTTRIVNFFGKGYLVGDSKAIHKRKNAKHTTLLLEDSKEKIGMYYYMYRNNLINARLYRGRIGVLKNYFKCLLQTFKIILSKSKYKTKKVFVLHKGILAYFFKIYDYKAIRNRLNS